ncbi:Zinc phosphodiesterase ELAC protein 2 [Rhizoclosmatium sp. JEL0117]|nr:Zinc phosphodiesterase ELAC protein 2 [Rhizoclosmatium sp. JEL0117]
MKYNIQVIGSATIDTRASVAVVFDSQRYLFNCGEGTQRFLNDRSRTCSAVSGAKTRNLFFTRNAWMCIGGLPGMILTLADAGGKGMVLRGPPGFTHSLAAMRQFLYRPQLPVQVKEYSLESVDADYHDENLTVKPVFLSPSPSKSNDALINSNGKRIQQGTDKRALQLRTEETILGQMFTNSPGPPVTPLYTGKKQKETASTEKSSTIEPGKSGHPLADAGRRSATANDTERLRTNRLDPCERSDTVIAYLCKGPKVLGKFDIAAAVALGIPRGPMYGALTKGNAVTLADGRVIQPEQCASPPKPGAMFIIIDVPSVDYIPSIQSNLSLQAASHKSNPIQCIVHLLGDGVLDHQGYKDWMNSFGDKCQHIVSSVDHNPQELVLHSTARIQHDLNYAENAVFPLPYFTNEAKVPLSKVPNLPKLTAPSRPLLSYQFEPKPLLDSTAVEPFAMKKSDSVSEETVAKFKKEADTVRASHVFGDPFRPLDNKDMICVPLGTGAAIPGKYRNVSSTYLRFSTGGIFLDAGEGTLAQFYRHYGLETDAELRQLRCIFVSHLHADHHLGAINILQRAYQLRRDTLDTDPICVVGPTRYLTWLSEYSDVEEFGFNKLVLVDSKDLMKDNNWNRIQKLKEVTKTAQFQTLLVKHCAAAYAVVITHESGIKVAFSGDCRPSNQFVEVGKDSTLVIHEATMDEDKKAEAIEKNHCTTNEAIDIAKRMSAKNLLLTHFSQRYPKLPRLDMKSHSASTDTLSIGVAFDSMRVRVSEFHQLQTLYGPLNTLWGRVVQEEEMDVLEGVGVSGGGGGVVDDVIE